MKFISVLFFLLIFIACTQNKSKEEYSIKNPLIKYAKNLEILEQKDFVLVHLKDPESHKIVQRIALIKNNSKAPTGYSVIKTPITSVIALSATHIGMLEKLNSLPLVTGISSHLYIHNPQILEKYKQGRILEMGDENAIPVESIIASKAKVLIYSGFGTSFQYEEQLLKMGIVCIGNYDWRENHPLGKAEWIKLFGYLTGKEKEASEYFTNVEKEYKRLQQVAKSSKSKPTLFSGNMVGDTWISPAGESFNAVLFTDANCKYIYSNTKGTGSLKSSFEKILKENRSTEFWFNPGAGSKKELLNAQPTLSNFDAVLNNKVYGYAGNEFWERSAIEPHHVLSDLIHILHPEISDKRNNYFYKQLK